MTLLIIGIALMSAGGVCVYLAGVSGAASALIVTGVYTLAAAIKAAIKKEQPK
jgi:hypothetical protein